MKKMSLQWRLTCITTLCIAIICGCLTMFVYKNGVHYIDSLQDAVESQGDEKGNKSDEIYISIPDDKWDEFADEFSVQVYNNKADYKKNSLIITAALALLGGVATYFISGHALRPLREFSDKIEKVQAQNLADSRIEENQVKELNQLSVSYNRMLERLSDAFEIQRQFTANAAHELRTPLALMQVQLDLYNSASHPGNDAGLRRAGLRARSVPAGHPGQPGQGSGARAAVPEGNAQPARHRAPGRRHEGTGAGPGPGRASSHHGMF